MLLTDIKSLYINNKEAKELWFGGSRIWTPTGSVDSTSFWATSSWSEIDSVLTSYYNGTITDLSSYFKVGDIRNISTTAIAQYGSTSYKCEAREQMTVPWVIIGVQHDDLYTATSAGVTKAAITVIPLYNYVETVMWSDTAATSYTDVSYAKTATEYSTSQGRTWLRDKFYPAIESGCQALIKEVSKQTSRTGSSSNTASANAAYHKTSKETVFLLSNTEVTGNSVQASPEGAQYEWFVDTANRKRATSKENADNSTFTTWGLRTSCIGYTSSSKTFAAQGYQVGSTGSATSSTYTHKINAGACMGFCL